MSGPTPASKVNEKGNRSKLFGWMKRLTKSKNGPKKAEKDDLPAKVNPAGIPKEGASGKPAGDGTNIANGDGNTFTQHATQGDGGVPVQDSYQSLTPTVHTSGTDCATSDTDQYSRATTSQTLTGGGADSTFSSTHSSHSLNTTLTTIQSTPSTNQVPNINQPLGQSAPNANQTNGNHSSQPSTSSTYFHHEYPTTPAPAIPPHLYPSTHVPTTYRSATAHNLLSDNASVLTLASSSHRPQRRNSLDTNASIRAIAPSSVWGGSRESLPLSVLSQREERDGATSSPTPPSTAGVIGSPTSTRASGFSREERSSLVNTNVGVGAPALSSERNSVYAARSPTSPKDKDTDTNSMNDRISLPDRLSLKAGSLGGDKFAADGVSSKSAGPSSVHSGLIGHGRNDSTTGSIGGVSSPLAGNSAVVDHETPETN